MTEYADGGGKPVTTWHDTRDVVFASWSADHRWLVYRTNFNLAGNGDIRAVRPGVDSVARDVVTTDAMEPTPTFHAGTPRVLFTGRFSRGAFHRVYDVAPDDRRFLMLREPPPRGESPSRLIYVQNFAEEVRQRVNQ